MHTLNISLHLFNDFVGSEPRWTELGLQMVTGRLSGVPQDEIAWLVAWQFSCGVATLYGYLLL